MKSERGSALLTVVFIVCITATLGASIASFIVMNFRLRALDNQIGRAEYETEKLIDIADWTLKEFVGDMVKTCAEAAEATVEADLVAVKTNGNAEDDNKYEMLINGQWEAAGDLIYQAKVNEFNSLYNEQFDATNIEDKICANINAELGIAPEEYIPSTFGKSGNTEIAVVCSAPSRVTGGIRQAVTVHYKIKNSPAITLTVDFIIVDITYVEAINNNYKLSSKIGMTNWEMREWKI